MFYKDQSWSYVLPAKSPSVAPKTPSEELEVGGHRPLCGVVSGEWLMVSGEWGVVSGEWLVVSGEW